MCQGKRNQWAARVKGINELPDKKEPMGGMDKRTKASIRSKRTNYLSWQKGPTIYHGKRDQVYIEQKELTAYQGNRD